MKHSIFTYLFLCLTLGLQAQIQTKYETILLDTDKKSYLYTDTIYISGMLVAIDVMMPSGISKYAIVDVADDKGNIVALKKVRLEDSFFNCRIPMTETGKSSFFIIRAYTEFMRNFPESTWPRIAVGVNNRSIPEIVQDKGLYSLENIKKTSFIYFSTNKEEYYPNDTLRLEVSNLGKDAHLMLRIEKDNKIGTSLLQGAIRRFRTINKEEFELIMQGNYNLRYYPEQTLSIGGKVMKEFRRKFKKGGKIVTFSHQTGAIYEYDIDNNGNFLFAINDFKDGEIFFLQAYDKKGKSYYYDIDIPEPTFPNATVPDIEWKNEQSTLPNNVSIKLDTIRTHWIPEIKITARLKKDDFYSPKFYKINYMEREDLLKRNYVTLEQIIEAMPGVEIGVDSLGRKAVLSRRGGSILGKKPIVKFKIDGAWASSHLLSVVEAELNVQDIASIEYIPAARSFAIHGPNAFYGVILVTTRKGTDKEYIQSKGVRYQPLGLSDNRPFHIDIPLHNLRIEQNKTKTVQFIAPNYAGDYQIIIEGVGNRKMIYEEIPLKVIP